ncbi:MAG TPA: hypothetical protein VHO24_11725 [Opitutaceae bacterium]|nr:hypothetical protein [Opitutaceae bacterium]
MALRSWLTRFIITRAARAYGFMDPINLMTKMRGFAQPSEVAEPIELLRAGVIFHARGLVNTKAIQNNLDWIWPYWVERQFNPADESFIPRAFSFSHINLTHRDWTAVGLPNVPFYPIVDPRGLVTPLFDGWSLDFWLLPEAGEPLFPSKLAAFEQTLALEDNLVVRSRAAARGLVLKTEVSMSLEGAEPHCCVRVQTDSTAGGYLVVALRPYNPEGISAIDRIALMADQRGWIVNKRNEVLFDREPARQVLSVYKEGDVSHRIEKPVDSPAEVTCPVGMATAVALFRLSSVRERPLEVRAPIYNELKPRTRPPFAGTNSWSAAMKPIAKLRVGDARLQRLYDLAAVNLVLHAPGEVYPGPYTYKRFWFRDAAFILNALLTLGGVERTRRVLKEFVPRQNHDGYFLSQEGEWDSNGEAIWTFHRFVTLTGEKPLPEWLPAIAKGARWIGRKRLPSDSGLPEAGLLPAGFSAEHLGPNDFYYWDDFWGVAGLRCAAEMLAPTDPALAAGYVREADQFMVAIERSFPAGPQRRFPGAIPASPKRRMDSGAIGSIVADYPLQLFAPGDERVLRTADYLRDHSSYKGCFFQHMIHSGINAYLTLHLAQVRLRAGEPEVAWQLMDNVAALASPTGQWPEAIHPRSGGGCMGDGEHIWAAAEWALMVRNCFVREEAGALVVGSGVRPEWWRDEACSFGPTLTPFGAVTLTIRPGGEGAHVTIDGQWRGPRPRLEVNLPGFAPQERVAASAREEFNLLNTTVPLSS